MSFYSDSIDPHLGVIRVDKADGTPLATGIYLLSCHIPPRSPSFVLSLELRHSRHMLRTRQHEVLQYEFPPPPFPLLFRERALTSNVTTGDIMGYTCDVIEQTIGGTAMFINADAGDIDPSTSLLLSYPFKNVLIISNKKLLRHVLVLPSALVAPSSPLLW